nr:hypothetical protein [Tanacetum cinerariifolium]
MGQPLSPDLDEVAEPIVEPEEQVIAPVIDMEEDIAMLFGDGGFSDDDSEGFKDEEEVGGPSTAAAEGPSFTLPAPESPVPPSVIEDLSTRMGNLEYKYGQLVKKVIQVMAFQMVQSIDRIERVNIWVEQGQQTTTQRDEAVEGLSQHVQALQADVQQRDSQIQ